MQESTLRITVKYEDLSAHHTFYLEKSSSFTVFKKRISEQMKIPSQKIELHSLMDGNRATFSFNDSDPISNLFKTHCVIGCREKAIAFAGSPTPELDYGFIHSPAPFRRPVKVLSQSMDGHLAGATKQQFFAQHRGSTQEEPASLRTFVLVARDSKPELTNAENEQNPTQQENVENCGNNDENKKREEQTTTNSQSQQSVKRTLSSSAPTSVDLNSSDEIFSDTMIIEREIALQGDINAKMQQTPQPTQQQQPPAPEKRSSLSILRRIFTQ